ncbi:MAG TPA: twin-arginine translocase TatA/TatE family subunit [Candidatus Polarisedimenticolia bacterium]|jgi:sec-independent protein translocase protein TatA
MGKIGFQELLILLLILVVLFGGAKLAGIGKGLGEGIRNFKKALKGEDEPDKDEGEKIEKKSSH